MAQNVNSKIINDSLTKARKYNEDKNYGRSFAHYLIVLQLLKPESRQKYEKEFTDVLHVWGWILHNRKQYEDLFKCYHLAILYFPASPEILNNSGVHALKLKNYKLAKLYFETSVTRNKSFLPAEQNLQTTKFMLVERWHFPMLNDIKRNESYAEAIKTEITNGFRDVLDIGTGTGILSLFALKHPQTKTIIACDYSEIMCETATNVFKNNNASNVTLLNKSSMDLKMAGDLKKRVSLVITEILDSGVFGENILETLIHAWDNLLYAPPYAKIIPAYVNIYITGIESDNLARKIRLNQRILDANKLCLTCLPITYDTENLKHEHVSYVTNTELALTVNFNDVSQLRDLLKRNNGANIQLKMIKNGRIDAFVVWFQLYLNDNISITNSPFSDIDSCWEQAIFYIQHPLVFTSNERIEIEMSCSKGYIDIIYNEIVFKHKCYTLPKNALLFLNDTELMKHLQDVSRVLSEKYRDCFILDLTPFPVFGLFMLQFKKTAKITCKVDDKTRDVIFKLCELNNIDKRRIKFVSSYDDFTDEKYHIIIQNYVNTCGLLNEEEIFNAEILRGNLTPDGLYLPGDVGIYAELIECDWLRKSTEVFDENCCGFKIAEYINEYKSTEQRDINITQIPHIKLTTPTILGYLNTKNILNASHTTKTQKIIHNGRADAIFYWFQVKYINNIQLNTNRNESFCKNAAFILHTNKNYCKNDTFNLTLKQHRGIIKIFIDE